MSGERPPPKIVVIDGLNVCHGGANGEGWDGRRLLSCISILESMGYGTIPVIGGWRLKSELKNKTPGFKRIQKLVNRPAPFGLRTTQGQDDVLVIQLAVSENAWIITQDGFGDWREKYPKGIGKSSWEEIDRLTVGTQWDGKWLNKGVHWNAQGPDFVWIDCPIPDAPRDFLIDEFNEERTLAMEAKKMLEKMHGSLESKAKGREEEFSKLLTLSAQIVGNFNPLEMVFPAKRVPNSDEIGDNFKLDDLRKMCSDRGIPKSGKKAEVVRRLIEFEEKEITLLLEKSDAASTKRAEDKEKRKEKRKLERQQQLEKDTNELMEKINDIGNVKLIEEIRTFYRDILAENHRKSFLIIDECVLFVDVKRSGRKGSKMEKWKVRINLIGPIHESDLVGRRGGNIKTVHDRTAEFLGCDRSSFNLEILFAKRRSRNHPDYVDYSEFLLGCKLVQLRDFSMQLGLPKSGSKEVIVNRIHARSEKATKDGELKKKERSVREKTKDIDSSAFFESLFSKMENPAQWTIFTVPYSQMVKEKPEFHLKSKGVSPTDFLKLHRDKVEISQRNGQPWIRKK
jgi:hypothetical protein